MKFHGHKIYVDKGGYHKCWYHKFEKDGVYYPGTVWTMQRLVYVLEVGPIPPNHEIHHINGIRDDNRIENLQCMPAFDHKSMTRKGSTHTEKTKRMIREKCLGRISPNRVAVRCLDTGDVYESISSAAAAIGAYPANISYVCRKPGTTIKKLRFEYIN